MKIYFSYDKKEREGYERKDPANYDVWAYGHDNVEEFVGENILEKLPNLIVFIECCYSLLKPGATATFTSPYYNSYQAWCDPRNIRGISQGSLNFADKKWREDNGCPDLCTADFEIGVNYSIDVLTNQRAEDAKAFWLSRYSNVIQSIMFTLKKR